MSLLYPNEGKSNITVEMRTTDENIYFVFFSNGGKFGTDEILDEHLITPEKLLTLLQQ